ncbi:MAG: M18 family aminopeptidase [Lachnospiraceae bacterium]|nr:M18 family aminopeptidase [Lachnospiraceae bacterium]
MEQKKFQNYTGELLDFIQKSPSPFHVIANLQEKLQNNGFMELKETDHWQLEQGRKYFVTRNDSSMIAFQIPNFKQLPGLKQLSKLEQSLDLKQSSDLPFGKCKGFHIVAAHSDSPSFKIKENPETVTDGRYLKLNTEKYGGMILSTWLDRPLSVAGRVVVTENYVAGEMLQGAEQDRQKHLVTKLVNLDHDAMVIPNLAIHMNRDMNKGVEYNPQIDMLPFYGDLRQRAESDEAGETDTENITTDYELTDMFMSDIAASAGVQPQQILGHDLFLYVRDQGRIFGRNGEFILSPKLDDLQCVYAAMEAFVTVMPREYISLCGVFDNEEVGSRTRQGADSTFLADTVERICEALYDICGESSAKTLEKRWIADSFLISADNAHAVHPNHPEKADPTNRPYLNGGIVIKYHGGQKYTTDAVSAARMKDLCNRAGVPYQTYANRSDIAGGSTLGNLSAGHLPVSSVDIGLPQLAMHSAVETGGALDTAYAVNVFEEFFRE